MGRIVISAKVPPGSTTVRTPQLTQNRTGRSSGAPRVLIGEERASEWGTSAQRRDESVDAYADERQAGGSGGRDVPGRQVGCQGRHGQQDGEQQAGEEGEIAEAQ